MSFVLNVIAKASIILLAAAATSLLLRRAIPWCGRRDAWQAEALEGET